MKQQKMNMSKEQTQWYIELPEDETNLSRHIDRRELEINLQNKHRLLVIIDEKYKVLYEENDRLKKEKDEAISRLSKLAGQKLTQGNPAITDLGNPNRPAKIGERWTSLYTDEWTDAYEELRDKNKKQKHENNPEKQLMWNTDWCYKKCSTLAGGQIKQLQPFLHGIANVLSLKEQLNNDFMRRDACFDKDNRLAVESFVEHFKSQRQNNTGLVTTVINICKNDFKRTRPGVGPLELKFVENCCELCWYMIISDPPMVIEYENLEGKDIDCNKFNKYDKNGTTIQYVVWPVLYLHKNGPVLAKGTVQTDDDATKLKC